MGIRFYQVYSADPWARFNNLVDKKLQFSATVIAEPDLADGGQKILVDNRLSKILLSVNRYPEYQIGDILDITVKLKFPEKFDGFNYKEYLAKDKIYLVGYYAQINKVGVSDKLKFKILRRVFVFKKYLLDMINSSMPEPESGLAAAVILGYKNTVSREDLNKFSVVGISHMIAISGTHITLLALIIDSILLFFSFTRKQSFWLSLIILSAYVVLTGCQSPAIRSLVMGGLVLWGKYLGRLSQIDRLLFFTLGVMLIFGPRYLLNDIGFQLSFLAIIALIYIYPVFSKLTEKRVLRIKNIFWRAKIKIIVDTFNMTMACQLISMPILAYNFGQISLIAPLANILILWIFGFLMVVLLWALLLTLIFPIAGKLFFLPSYLALKYIFILTNILANVPYAAINLKK